MLRQFIDGWKYIGKTPLVRGLVLGILGAFAGGGIVIGTAKFFANSLGAGDAAFYLLFGALFVGLAIGIGARADDRPGAVPAPLVRHEHRAAPALGHAARGRHPPVHGDRSARCWSAPAPAWPSWPARRCSAARSADDVRGRVFAVVQTGTRVVLMLAISLSSVLVGLGGSRELSVGDSAVFRSPPPGCCCWPPASSVSSPASARSGRWTTSRACRCSPTCGARSAAGPCRRGRAVRAAGLFVVFEGGEGAGKSTQVSRLAEALRQHGPGRGGHPRAGGDRGRARGSAAWCWTACQADAAAPLAPRAEALLYAADRAHHVATVVRPALARGAVVISDRYVDSSLAYQGAGRTLPVEEVSWLSAWATGGLKPDLVVLLDIDPAAGLARVGSARQRRRPAGGRVARRSTSGSGTRSSTWPPPTPSATWCSTPPGRPRRSPPR